MGATCQATGVHLHFQIDKGSSTSAINPYDYVFNGKEFESTPSGKKSNEEIAREVIRGDWGNGDERKRRLVEAGYDYNAVQSIVNQKVGSSHLLQTDIIQWLEVIRFLWGIMSIIEKTLKKYHLALTT